MNFSSRHIPRQRHNYSVLYIWIVNEWPIQIRNNNVHVIYKWNEIWWKINKYSAFLLFLRWMNNDNTQFYTPKLSMNENKLKRKFCAL